MFNQKFIKTGSKVFVALSVFSIGSVSIMSMISPQSTMDLVSVSLDNTDAMSSIRGVYGGVGLSITVCLLYLMLKDIKNALRFLSLFWGMYAFSRLITILMDGALGSFGNQWIITETVFCLISLFFMLNLKPLDYAEKRIS